MSKPILAVAGVIVALWSALSAQQPSPAHELGIKYMRDSEEYATLARQTYRLAGEAVTRTAGIAGPWTVVLDIDETALDNSTYQLEQAAYALPIDSPSFSAWAERRQAAAVPGAVDFIRLVRRANGHVAWISNRAFPVADATRANLTTVGLWNDDDRLCLQKTPQHTKGDRRREVLSGKGECAWPATPMRVAAFVGDQLGDFPESAEQIPGTGNDAAFGRTCFLLPNSMYGAWTTRVTRVR